MLAENTSSSKIKILNSWTNMENKINLREELVNIIKIRAAEGPGQRRNRKWFRSKNDRRRRMGEALIAIEDSDDRSWVEQLSEIILEFEGTPGWESTLEKLKFGNQVELKRLGDWKNEYKRDFNYLVPVAVIQDLMEDENKPMTLVEALQEATKNGKAYSQYNWVEEDVARLEGRQREKKEEKQDSPKEKRKRGEGRVSRVMKMLQGALEDGIMLKANGHLLKTLSERNLDNNGVTFSAAATRHIYTKGNRTFEVHFFKKSRTTLFKKEPTDMDDKITALLKEGKTKQEAEDEIMEVTKLRENKNGKRGKTGDEKEEEAEDFYMSADHANTRKKATVWKSCNICYHLAGKKWEIQETNIRRHFQRYHSETMKMELLQGQKTLIRQLTPVIKIQHLESEKKRHWKEAHHEPAEADPKRRYKMRYLKEEPEGRM